MSEQKQWGRALTPSAADGSLTGDLDRAIERMRHAGVSGEREKIEAAWRELEPLLTKFIGISRSA